MPGKETELQETIMEFANPSTRIENAADISDFDPGMIAAIEQMIDQIDGAPNSMGSALWPDLLRRWLNGGELLATRNALKQG